MALLGSSLFLVVIGGLLGIGSCRGGNRKCRADGIDICLVPGDARNSACSGKTYDHQCGHCHVHHQVSFHAILPLSLEWIGFFYGIILPFAVVNLKVGLCELHEK